MHVEADWKGFLIEAEVWHDPETARSYWDGGTPETCGVEDVHIVDWSPLDTMDEDPDLYEDWAAAAAERHRAGLSTGLDWTAAWLLEYDREGVEAAVLECWRTAQECPEAY